jgi:hypothetical protein
MQLARALTPVSVAEVELGDFICDKQGVLHEIKFNSAANTLRPRSWQIQTIDGKEFNMHEVSAYLKRSEISEDFIQSHKPPSLYRWLTLTACETACNAGITTLWCQVRVGNTAREKHLAVGWEETGIFYSSGEIKFEILRLDPYKTVTGLESNDLAQLREAHLKDQTEYARLRSLSSDAWSPKPEASAAHKFLAAFANRFPEHYISSNTDSIGRLHITLTHPFKRPIYFIQGLAGHDLWRAKQEPSYSVSLDTPLSSLALTAASTT